MGKTMLQRTHMETEKVQFLSEFSSYISTELVANASQWACTVTWN